MEQLSLLRDDQIISNGSIVRLFEVERFDVMKNIIDRDNNNKRGLDFYDYMVVDCKVIKDKTYSLINITMDNSNRGSILCEIENTTVDGVLVAGQLKKYFSDNKKVFIELNK